VSQFYLSNAGYSAPEQWQFCRELRRRLETVPGVAGVSYSDVVPMFDTTGGGWSPWQQLEVEGYAPAPNEQIDDPPCHRCSRILRFLWASGCSKAAISPSGTPSKRRWSWSSMRLCAAVLQGANPIGRKVRMGGNPTTVVGLVKDSKYHTPLEGPTPFFYVPFRQWFRPGLNFSVFVKTAGDR